MPTVCTSLVLKDDVRVLIVHCTYESWATPSYDERTAAAGAAGAAGAAPPADRHSAATADAGDAVWENKNGLLLSDGVWALKNSGGDGNDTPPTEERALGGLARTLPAAALE